MTTTILILVVLGLYMAFCYYKGRDTEAEDAHERVIEQSVDDEKLGEVPTRVLVMKTLRNMGCDPMVGDEGNIFFSFQGERFMIVAENESLCIDLYDTWWWHMSMDDDIEVFAQMQKAVNRVNANAGCTVLYSFDDEEQMIGLHLKLHMSFISQIPGIEKYMAAMLECFFRAQRAVMAEMERNKMVDKERMKQ